MASQTDSTNIAFTIIVLGFRVLAILPLNLELSRNRPEILAAAIGINGRTHKYPPNHDLLSANAIFSVVNHLQVSMPRLLCFLCKSCSQKDF